MFIHICVTSWEIDNSKPPVAGRPVVLKLRVEENPDVPATLSINNTCVRSNFSLPQNGRFTPCITFFQQHRGLINLPATEKC